MKKFFISLAIICCGFHPILAQERLEISYKVNRIPGPGSNQIAVWIEDENGHLVKSIYASKFTAEGGYSFRPVSLSEWIEKSDWVNASEEEIDAVSGSTQTDGLATVVWNLTDKAGNKVEPGVYLVRIEANIKNDKKMFYSGGIRISAMSVDVEEGNIYYSEDELSDGNQIFENVKITVVK